MNMGMNNMNNGGKELDSLDLNNLELGGLNMDFL